MLCKRILVCLDVQDGRVVKGVGFRDLKDMGDPVELAVRYEAEGADEIVFLDISASVAGRQTMLDVVRRTAERLFIPLTVGGGVSAVSDVDRVLRAGADKVSINTAAVLDPELLTEAASRFGSQCVVASIDAARTAPDNPVHPGSAPPSPESLERVSYRVHTHGGRTASQLGAIEWAVDCARLGAGEILLTSIDRDGRRDGYDLGLTAAVAHAVTVPVIASGGAGDASHIRAALTRGGADAALAAGIFHDRTTTVARVKRELADHGLRVRMTDLEPS